MALLKRMEGKLYSIVTNYVEKVNLKKTFKDLKFVLEDEDFSPIKNNRYDNIKSIAFFVPGIAKYSGGSTSILRIGTELSRMGYDITYVITIDQEVIQAKKAAKMNLNNYLGSFIHVKDTNINMFDVVVATYWATVYIAKKYNGYKAYFIQDFEPFFYSLSDQFLLAKKSYEMGFHQISLGKWNLTQIDKFCNVNCKRDYISFPYEKKEYSFLKRNFYDYQGKTHIKIAVYIKEEGKRLPILIPLLLDKLKEKFNDNGKELEIIYFGNKLAPCSRNGISRGKLSKIDLLNLYNECDFGLVASMSNISLIPYEMIASGLPIIEFIDGSFNSFFRENCAIMTNLNINTLFDNIVYMIENPKELNKMVENSVNYIQELSWEKSSRQFERILLEAKNEEWTI